MIEIHFPEPALRTPARQRVAGGPASPVFSTGGVCHCLPAGAPCILGTEALPTCRSASGWADEAAFRKHQRPRVIYHGQGGRRTIPIAPVIPRVCSIRLQ